MWKWILAALAVPVMSIAIAIGYANLEAAENRRGAATPRAFGVATLADEYRMVPFAAVLANPERYEGQRVLLQGFLVLEHEDMGIHPDEQSWAAGLRSNSIMVDPPAWANRGTRARLTRRYATVAGTFTLKDGPGYGYTGGSLHHIEQIEPTYTNAQFQRMMVRNHDRLLLQTVFSGWFLSVVGWTTLACAWGLRRRRS